MITVFEGLQDGDVNGLIEAIKGVEYTKDKDFFIEKMFGDLYLSIWVDTVRFNSSDADNCMFIQIDDASNAYKTIAYSGDNQSKSEWEKNIDHIIDKLKSMLIITESLDSNNALTRITVSSERDEITNVIDESNPSNWHSNGGIYSFDFSDGNRYLIDFNGGWTSEEDRYFVSEFKNLTTGKYSTFVAKSGRDIAKSFKKGNLSIQYFIDNATWGDTNPKNSNFSSDHLSD